MEGRDTKRLKPSESEQELHHSSDNGFKHKESEPRWAYPKQRARCWSVLVRDILQRKTGSSITDTLYFSENFGLGIQIAPIPAKSGVECHARARIFSPLKKWNAAIPTDKIGRIAFSDHFLRYIHASLEALHQEEEEKNECVPRIKVPLPSQFIFERNFLDLKASDVISESGISGDQLGNELMVVSVELSDLFVSTESALQHLLEEQLPDVVNGFFTTTSVHEAFSEHEACLRDQRDLRRRLGEGELPGVAFVADGAVLPRASALDDRPMQGDSVVPFQSPKERECEVTLLSGRKIKGMLVPRGVTVVIGGGFHGKSTLLRALAVGVYDKVAGDGREFVVQAAGAVTVRAEDGRPVAGVDVSPFIAGLPRGVRADPSNFSTAQASGSTSQAAAVIEAAEMGATCLLLDEDQCAANFMIRDSRMRAIVWHEPIIPYIYRVNGLWTELGISTIVVIGGCGDWFDVHDQVILMDNYVCEDKTMRATSISRTFCKGRVQYKGRGLVHRLGWPGPPPARAPVAATLAPRGGGGRVAAEGDGGGGATGGRLLYGDRVVDLSRLEQLAPGGAPHLRAAGLGAAWVARRAAAAAAAAAGAAPLSLRALLADLDAAIDRGGLGPTLLPPPPAAAAAAAALPPEEDLIRPRMFEVAACINRLMGVTFQRYKEDDVTSAPMMQQKNNKDSNNNHNDDDEQQEDTNILT